MPSASFKLEEHLEPQRHARSDFHTLIEGPRPRKHRIRTMYVGGRTNDLPSKEASGENLEVYAVVDVVARGEDGSTGNGYLGGAHGV